jgi:hypothetical protein
VVRKEEAVLEAQAHSVSVAQVAATRLAVRRLDTGLAEVVVRRHLSAAMDLQGLSVFATNMRRERHYFFDLLHSGLPPVAEIERTYKMEHAPAVTRHSFPGWTDGKQLPPPSWYDAAAAGLRPIHGWVLIDHEDWGEATQAARLQTAANFAALYRALKSRRPDLKFAFYGYGVKHNNIWPSLGIDSPDYQAWQRMSDDYAEMLAVVDALCPTLYFWFTEADDGLAFTKARSPGVFRGYLTDARRLLDQYGAPNRPVYPYIWWRKHDASKDLEDWIWRDMLETTLSLADGFVLWGGYQQTWNRGEEWLKSLLDARYAHRPRQGRSRLTKAAG